MTRALAWLAVLTLGGCASCGSEATGPAPSHVTPEAARAQVEALFAAVHARDCDAAGALLPRLTGPESCDELFEEWEHHGMELVEIRDARVDGRDRGAAIVRCVVRMSGRERELLVRAEGRPGGRWALML